METGGCVPPADLEFRSGAVAEPSRDFTEDFPSVAGLPHNREILPPVRVTRFASAKILDQSSRDRTAAHSVARTPGACFGRTPVKVDPLPGSDVRVMSPP